ncbi:NlpC/P60 family protein [Microscilla marina]|uniref:Cell wall-associated hydrolase n=1 Tax=Microscilla marina ATCC 23134 TaxID=313606 RepID=A1ZNH7_MICM2|nr:NlpC/P60 family protein [Microscilla marina]EAY28088.1 cell wall-associated hydrolase [Microscilla marina ATCC 23134]
MIDIPPHFFEVTYQGAHYPGSPKVNGLQGGANCQVFAYELLRHHGLKVPDFRSSDLWEDTIHTQQVTHLQPLDILLWNKTPNSWGAHVGVYIGNNQAVHLSKVNHTAVIWTLEHFLEQPAYKVFIGAKRILNNDA